MKEILNAFRGIKEPMHVIMEEDERYEQSIIWTHAELGEGEYQPDMNESNGEMQDPSKTESLENSGLIDISLTTPADFMPANQSEQERPAIQFDYNEPDQKEGHLLFNVLKTDIVKAFNMTSSSKADVFLDKVTFIARKMVNIWFGKQIDLENFNMFVDLLKEKAYLMSFPLMLESFRKMSCFELDPNGYQPFCELILASLTEVLPV